MPAAYSNDLRRKLLEAYQQGEGTLEEMAERFSVGIAWVKKISAQFSRTGKMDRQPGAKRGPVSKITPEIERDLKLWIDGQPDLTLSELRRRLMEEGQVKISVSRLWGVLERMGMRLKKVAPRLRTSCRSGTEPAPGLA